MLHKHNFIEIFFRLYQDYILLSTQFKAVCVGEEGEKI